MVNDNVNALDLLAEAALHTVEEYKELIKGNRWADARECLYMVEGITQQIHQIEDHVPPTNYDAQVAYEAMKPVYPDGSN